MSKADEARSGRHGETPAPIIILISSDDEHTISTRPAEGGDQADVVRSRTQPGIACSRRLPRTPRPPPVPSTHRSGDDESDVISITSSEAESDDPPPATQSRAPGLTSTSHQVPHPARPERSHRGRGIALLRTESRTLRAARSPPLASQRRAERARAIPRSRSSRAPHTRPVVPDNESTVITPPSSTQPRTTSSRTVVRSRAPSREVEAHTHPAHNGSENDTVPPDTELPRIQSRDLQSRAQNLPATANRLPDASEAGSSNKENNGSSAVQSCLDFQRSARLSARQAVARRQVGVFSSLAQTSSSPSLSGSNKNGSDDDEAHQNSDATVQPVTQVQSHAEDAAEPVDATEAFGDPFRFEVYPVVPGLVTSINPYAERRHWILTVKIWYKVRLPPVIPLPSVY